MRLNEIGKIKKAITYLKVANRSDYVTFHAMVDGETFNEEVIKPLEKIVEWNEKDEKLTAEITEQFKKEGEGKTLKERSEKLKKLLKIGGTAGLVSVIASGIGFTAYRLLKTNSAKK